MNAAASALVHVLDGRLRIKVSGVKDSPRMAREIERWLMQTDGIDRVKANPTTGSVLIHYNSSRITQNEILTALEKSGWLREQHDISLQTKGTNRFSRKFGEAVVKSIICSTVELTLQRIILALI